jgi:hypothetical protein
LNIFDDTDEGFVEVAVAVADVVEEVQSGFS